VGTMLHTETLTAMVCGNCGVAFAVPEKMRAEKESDGGYWYCPNGHSRIYKKTTAQELEEEKARRKRAELRAQANRELLEAEERSHASTRGHLTRVKKRTAHGVCPCCNRTFQNVARHMESKHPDYIAGTS
jgi:DNA repair exonuclease SbcCD ATPase subunit